MEYDPQRRMFFKSLFSQKEKAPFSAAGEIAISRVPPQLNDLSPIEKALVIIGTAAFLPLVSRRRFLQANAAAFALAPVFFRKTRSNLAVVPIPFEMSRGRHRSYPWLPASTLPEGDWATGLHEGGPWDQYDAVDRYLNGDNARSIYWPKLGGFPSTREWLTSVAANTLDGTNAGWAGYCTAAESAAYFSPKIEGDLPVAGGTFDEWSRLAVSTMRHSGFLRDPYYTTVDENSLWDLKNRVNNGEPVVVNFSPKPGEEWWGLATDVDGDTWTLTIFTKWGQNGLITKVMDTYSNLDGSKIRGGAVLHSESPHPGYEGNFAVVDRIVGGVILGTHALI